MSQNEGFVFFNNKRKFYLSIHHSSRYINSYNFDTYKAHQGSSYTLITTAIEYYCSFFGKNDFFTFSYNCHDMNLLVYMTSHMIEKNEQKLPQKHLGIHEKFYSSFKQICKEKDAQNENMNALDQQLHYHLHYHNLTVSSLFKLCQLIIRRY